MDSKRIPPQDIEAEQAVLGAMILDSNAIPDVLNIIEGKDYYRPNHQIVHETIVELYSKGDSVDSITVADQLNKQGNLERIGGREYLFTLVSSVSTVANVGYHARIIKERSQLRSLVQAGTRVMQLGYTDDTSDIQETINQAQAEIYALTQNKNSTDYKPIKDTLAQTMDQLLALRGGLNNESSIKTNFYDLDRSTNGLKGGQLIIVAARPAMGKSTFALDICRAASIHDKQTSIIFSLEMDSNEITKRLIAAEGRISLGKLSSGELEKGEWEKITLVVKKIERAPLYIDDSPNLTLPEIRSKCRQLKQQHGLSLVVVDYLQLMTSGKRVESRQQEVADFSRSLKLLAKELDVPIIAVAQLNRGPEQRTDHKPMLSDLRESGSLEQDADIVMMLNRPQVYDENDRPGEADLIVAKHRAGPTGIYTLLFEGQYSRFVNPARE